LGSNQTDPTIAVDVKPGATAPWYPTQTEFGRVHTRPAGFPGAGTNVDAMSMYDKPNQPNNFEPSSGHSKPLARHGYIACVVCIRAEKPDLVLDCIDYVYTRSRAKPSKPWGDALAHPTSPGCVG